MTPLNPTYGLIDSHAKSPLPPIDVANQGIKLKSINQYKFTLRKSRKTLVSFQSTYDVFSKFGNQSQGINIPNRLSNYHFNQRSLTWKPTVGLFSQINYHRSSIDGSLLSQVR
jgi:hypothetical protein